MESIALTLLTALLIGVGANLGGKWLAERFPRIPRLLWWLGVLVPYFTVHLLMFDEPAFFRMVGLCTNLLLGMKVITYMEWLKMRGCKIAMPRWFAFSFLWFGMQPKAWVGERRTREWKSHVRAAFLCIAMGAVGLSLYVYFDGKILLLSFVFMSLMFHYGVLRLNTAFWRAMGFPVRTLFRNPLLTTGFKDFWGARWNLAYSQMMARAVQKPLTPKFGTKGAVFTVFLVSGLFHELAITVPAMQGYGLPTLFFLFQGLAILVEKKPHRAIGLLCLLSLVIGLPILFPPRFVTEIFQPVEEMWQAGLFSLL